MFRANMSIKYEEAQMGKYRKTPVPGRCLFASDALGTILIIAVAAIMLLCGTVVGCLLVAAR